jgi:hypothetical protein
MILLTDDLGNAPGLCPRLDSGFRSSEFGSDLGQRRSRRGKFGRCQWFIANRCHYDLNAIRSYSASPVGVTIAA